MAISKNEENLLADRLRRCYQFERNCYARTLNRPDDYRVPSYWDTDRSEAREPSVWHKLARFCKRRQIDPFRYTHWSLSVNQVLLGPPPEPNQLLSPKRMDRYVETRPNRLNAIKIGLGIQKRAAESECGYRKTASVSWEDTWAAVLCSSHLQISALLRYCLALSFKSKRFLGIADYYKSNAMLVYHHDSINYAAVWPRHFFPPGFAEEAAEFYLELLDREP